MTKENKTVPCKRNLKCVLTTEELLDKGQDLTAHMSTVERIEAELTSFKSGAKARIDEASAKVAQLKQQVAEKAEWRDVDCEEVHDTERRMVVLWRLDTNAIVSERPMLAHELQLELPEVQS